MRIDIAAAARVALGLAALLLVQLLVVPATNFGGFDEWMVLELNARNVVSVPYCHRPFNWIWSWPASRLADLALAPLAGFAPFSLAFGLYTLLGAALCVALVRRLVPERPLLALLTGVFLIVWAPGDMARLSTVDRVLYAGETLAVLAAMLLLVEAWLRASLSWAVGAALAAAVAALSYEGTLPLLAGAPLLLLLVERPSRRLARWTLAWEALIASGFAYFAVATWLLGSTYQLSVLGGARDPASWLSRMALQYAYHLVPLANPSLAELARPAVGAAVGVLALLLALCAPLLVVGTGTPAERRRLLWAAALGLVLAGLGYSLILFGVSVPTAFRLEILSGPGIALALAALVLLAGSAVPGRGGIAVAAALSAWIVAVGTGRTVAMQDRWDRGSFFLRQARALTALAAAVPGVKPHTLLVLIDQAGAWQATYGFHHAVQYLYERRASGFVPGVWDALDPVSFAADGAHLEPWPINRAGWDAPADTFRYDEIVALRHRGGSVELLEEWPPDLPPLPPGARYQPRARLAAGPPPRLRILGAQGATR